MLMVAGGHFAGMVIGLKPRGKSDRQEVKGAGEVRVLQHKTFHRYTSTPAHALRSWCAIADVSGQRERSKVDRRR